MSDRDKTRRQLLAENETLRQQVAALVASDRRFRKYFDQELIGMAAVAADGRWIEVNDRFCQILGYSREEILRTNWKDLSHPDDLEHTLANAQEMASGQIDHHATEKRYLRKDGSTVYTAIAIQAIRGDDGTVEGAIGLMEDITARKQAEEALERERQSLWRMLEASDHERQTISYEIHDGLAQYLAAAGMQFQAYEALAGNSPNQARKAFQTAVELVRQSHAEARRLISEVRPPVIDEVGLETALSHLVHQQRQRGGPKIQFDSDVQFDRLALILENALYRIAQEALNNACKHSQSKEVRLALAQDGPEVRLEVQDWGVGFEPQVVEKGRFGLEGIRQRVRLLGGRLTIVSTPGAGTLIQVIVPILEQQPDA